MTIDEGIDVYNQGRQAYFDEVEDCPYSHDTEFDFWSLWCDGHNDAYCDAECK